MHGVWGSPRDGQGLLLINQNPPSPKRPGPAPNLEWTRSVGWGWGDGVASAMPPTQPLVTLPVLARHWGCERALGSQGRWRTCILCNGRYYLGPAGV